MRGPFFAIVLNCDPCAIERIYVGQFNGFEIKKV
jgi:hypothetical protein